MPDMFCFQCQQTAGNKGCVQAPASAASSRRLPNLQDELVYALIRLAELSDTGGPPARSQPPDHRRPVHHPDRRKLRQRRHPGVHPPGFRGDRQAGRLRLPPGGALEGRDRHRLPAVHPAFRDEGHGRLRPPRLEPGLPGRRGHGLVRQGALRRQPGSTPWRNGSPSSWNSAGPTTGAWPSWTKPTPRPSARRSPPGSMWTSKGALHRGFRPRPPGPGAASGAD